MTASAPERDAARLALAARVYLPVSDPDWLCPCDAERDALQAGLFPFVPDPPHDSAEALMSKPWWPLTLGSLWAAWRQPETVARRWAAFAIWKRMIWTDPISDGQLISLHAAEREIWNALEAGRLRAHGLMADGSRAEITALQWCDLHWLDHGLRQSVARLGLVQPAFDDVLVDASQLRLIWAPVPSRANPAGALVPVAELTGFLKGLEPGSKEADARLTAIEHFAPRTFRDATWRQVWRNIPGKRRVGQRDRSFKSGI